MLQIQFIIGHGSGHIKVVGGADDTATLVGEVAEEGKVTTAGFVVEEGCGLIEEQDRGLLSQGGGNHHTLPLTIRELTKRASGKVRQATFCKGIVHDSSVCIGQHTHQAVIGRASHLHHLSHAEVDGLIVCLHYGTKTSQRARRIISQRFSRQHYAFRR